MQKYILFLSANPNDINTLQVDPEIRDIIESLRRAKYRDKFGVIYQSAVRYSDLVRALLDYQPQIIHFAGHGIEGQGIVLLDESGNASPIGADVLCNLFGQFQWLECVFLNACYTAAQAEKIVQSVRCVVGMPSSISDQAAKSYAVSFYDALGAGSNYQFAHNIGCNALLHGGSTLDALPNLVENDKNHRNFDEYSQEHATLLKQQADRKYTDDLSRTVHSYTIQIIDEILTSLSDSQDRISGFDVPDLNGTWEGLVDLNKQVIEIFQMGPVVNILGTAYNKDSDEVIYKFNGRGRIIHDLLVFSWIINSERQGSFVDRGTNVMKIRSSNQYLDGKFFNALGNGPGYEIYQKRRNPE